jgi:4-hydroxybenzoate polyprenyltransferase/phosphoserine phosphatase
MSDANKPLCVDCDGTLIHSDLLYEAFFLMIKQYPQGLFLLPFWLLKGKAYVKQRMAEHVEFDFATLPYRSEVIALINQARALGRQIVLATASPIAWANGIAQHLGCFDKVIATENGVNLGGKNKAAHLLSLYGARGFDYVGDAPVDQQVWQHAAGAIIVSSNSSLIQQAEKVTSVIQIIKPKRGGIATYLRALRVHQWLKNLLVFVPLLAAHQISSYVGLMQAVHAFVAFSFCASSVYILNDLLDLDSDRQHIRKRKRPFAACTIPLWQGMLLIPVLLAFAVAISLMLSAHFLWALIAYFFMTLAYSIRLKRQVIVDVMLLAGLYTMRIIAGAVATKITPSFWLLAFSMFIFLSLAMVKRYSELLITLQENKQEAAGRGYSTDDLSVLMSIGVSSGMGSVLILALYLNNPETYAIYPNTMWLWLIPPLLLYWISRMWMKAHRGEVDDDPVVFAARDWQSLVVLLLSAGIFAMAIL